MAINNHFATTRAHRADHPVSNELPHPNGSVRDMPQHDIDSSDGEPAIAICGMALRLPNGLRTPQHLWEFLLNKKDARSRVPESRYNVSAFYDPTGKPGSVKTEYGYFLEDDLGCLDTTFFTMTRMEVERADPHQRLMLEVARESIEDAAEVGWRGKPIGCYMGTLGEDWCEMFARETQHWGTHRVTGFGDFALSNRVSYEMDLRGPSMTIRTACSASLVALHEACTAILRGDCDSAIVGGANLIMTPGATMSMTEQGVLSPDGSCKTFSAEANGYARGEAITAVYVKRLDLAVSDGNPVRGIIRGTATNHDGKTPGMTFPNTEAHEVLIRKAYQKAGIEDCSRTAFVECHGTGTAIGDPIETNAVARVFNAGVHIGSIKPNFGHTEGASGLLSTIKAVLALENRTIPPNIKFITPNPAIPFKSSGLIVPTDPTPWPQGRLERVSVNSYGVGGTNAHVIIDSAASFNTSVAPTTENDDKPQVLLYSANSPKSLSKIIDSYREIFEQSSNGVQDIAYTLANGREHLSYRAYAIANEGTVSAASSVHKISQPPKLVMVFTGQGAQWSGMGRELVRSNPTFRASIRSLDKHLQSLNNEKGWTIEDELQRSSKKSLVHRAELAQPLCTALQVALIDTLSSLGVKPDAVVGHSSGEIAAAYAAGSLTAVEAITAAYYRGVISNCQERPGAMAAIGMGWDEVQKCLIPNVTIACDNSPSSVTISGDTDQVEAVITNIRKLQSHVMARRLQVNKAYHSYHMAEVGEEYLQMMEGRIIGRGPKIPFFSSVTGQSLDRTEPLGPAYWRRNLEHPVLFRETISSLLQSFSAKNPVFLEIGPHSALAGPLRQTLAHHSATALYVSAMIRGQDTVTSLLAAVGKLYTFGVSIDLKALIPTGTCLPDLPRYPWNHEESYWFESRLSKEHRHRKFSYHDLLGSRIVECTELEPAWRNLFHLDNAPWARDHKVADDIIFPFAGYAAMAGEAVRQITGIQEAYRLRRVIVTTALVVTEGKPIEMVTTCRPRRLTDALNSEWWEFTISAYNGHVWTKHCSGEVLAQAQSLGQAKDIACFPRKVGARQWFDTLRRSGLNLGSTFRNLAGIAASANSQLATGSVLNNRLSDSDNYHIHPTVIDAALQLLAVASAHGQARRHQNMLPVSCEEFSVSRCSSDFTVSASTERAADNAITGQSQGAVHGVVVLIMRGLKLAPVQDFDSTIHKDAHATARLTWGPDVDFIDVCDIIRPAVDRSVHHTLLKELHHLCLAHSQRMTANVNSARDHLQRYKNSIESQSRSLEKASYAELDTETIREQIDHIGQRLATSPAKTIANALQRVCLNMRSILSGDIISWEALLSNDELADFYAFLDPCHSALFVSKLAHSIPNLRILELGSWKNTPSLQVLDSLSIAGSAALCSKYTFTSPGYISAKDRLPMFPNLEYATLDINEDPLDQGFEGQHYDLIIASNAVHSARSLGAALSNLKKILKPNGRLLLQELNSGSKWVNFILGSLPSWWCGLVDDRIEEPYVNANRWQTELESAGFESACSTIVDSDKNHVLNNIMIARPKSDWAPSKLVTILHRDDQNDLFPIRRHLESQGYEVKLCTLNDAPHPGQDIISILDNDGPFFEAIVEDSFEDIKKFLRQLKNAGIFWITRHSHIRCADARYAQAIGFARTVRSELLIDFATCEVEDPNASLPQVIDVFRKFQARRDDEALKNDFEYSIFEGTVHVGRFYPFALPDELVASDPRDRAILDVGTAGRLRTLHWKKSSTPVVLRPGDVEVEVYAVGLNFRDVLVAMKLVETSQRVFGLEGAGIVRRIGSAVESLKVGDRVAVIDRYTFASTITTPELLCIKLPDTLSFIEASTMFFPFATALHSLITVGGLEKGQSVLIHSACGGVGLAAIQIAQMLEAEVYVTVGTKEKACYIMDKCNIPRQRIFDSRNDSFVEGVLKETGEGVDVVLNSLSGELLHASWRCVAPFGKLVEIGKRDLLGFGKLDMNTFLANRSYCCVELDAYREKPLSVNRMLRSVLEFYQSGHISPLRPIKVFDADSTYEAFRYMQPGQHIGRICVSLRDSPDCTKLPVEIMDRPRSLNLKADASYLLVGGLGGLGRSISTWMAENGARHLTYLSRSAGLKEDEHLFIDELASMGCHAQLIRGSVVDIKHVEKAIKTADRPIRGIIQMSMVLQDENFLKMSINQWNSTVQPKVQGTWNLHHASTGLDLDFFVLFSSLSGIIGQPGQANYASANTFLDAFVQHRNQAGLPASAIDIGAVGDVGYISQDTVLLQQMTKTGFKPLREQDVLDALMVAMTSKPKGSNHTQTHGALCSDSNNFVLGLGSSIPFNSPNNRSVWRRDRRMGVYHNTITDSTATASSDSSLKAYIISAKADVAILKAPEAASFLAREIGKRLFALLLKPEENLNTSLSLSDLGMDSLVGIEMRVWWKQMFGFDISVLEMLGMGTLEALGKHGAEELVRFTLAERGEA